MKFRDLSILFFLSLGVLLLIATFQPVPGYMDAEYYHAVGLQMATGKGWTEPFIWNYLDDPSGLPHPANTYWMPLAGFLSAAGMVLTGQADFLFARLPFILLAALVPVFSSTLAFRLTCRRSAGWLAGGLSIFSGFYALYLGLTETFALYMLLGTIFLWLATQLKAGVRMAMCLGAIAGLMHLARADGVVWLVAAVFIVGLEKWKRPAPRQWKASLVEIGIGLLAYGLVMAVWYGRNVLVFGGLFPPGSSKAMWLIDYDQLYTYPADHLTVQNWMASGWLNLLQVRWDALIANLQTTLGVQGAVFLAPLILAGGWRLRNNALVQTGIILWFITLLLMTVVFPLAGSRGGFLHSGAAFQPLFWALASEGLMGFIDLGVRWRNWKRERAAVGFGWIAVVIAALLTCGVVGSRLAGDESTANNWQSSWEVYQAAGNSLQELGVSPAIPVMVNDPPGFYLAAQRPAFAIPDGDLATLLSASQRYQAKYLVLEENTVKGLRWLYRQPQDQPGLRYLSTVGKAHLFQILMP